MVSPKSSLSGKTKVNREMYITIRLLKPWPNDLSEIVIENYISKCLK